MWTPSSVSKYCRAHNAVTVTPNVVLPGNATNNLWVLDLTLDLLDIRQAEL
jgi:hypothetical protein